MKRFTLFLLMLSLLMGMLWGCQRRGAKTETGETIEEKGESIPFDVRAGLDVAVEEPAGNGMWILTSQKQLETLCSFEQTGRGYACLDRYYKTSLNGQEDTVPPAYLEDYFEEGALVVLFLNEEDGARHRVNSLVRKEEELCAELTRFFPADHPARPKPAYWRIFLEVKRSDVEGLTKVRYTIKESGEDETFAAETDVLYTAKVGFVPHAIVCNEVNMIASWEEFTFYYRNSFGSCYDEEIESLLGSPEVQKEYGDEFFRENVLFIVTMFQENASKKHRIDSLIRQGNLLSVDMTRILANGGTQSISTFCSFLEVKHLDMEGVEKVSLLMKDRSKTE